MRMMARIPILTAMSRFKPAVRFILKTGVTVLKIGHVTPFRLTVHTYL